MNSFYQLLKITLEGLLVPFGFETFLLSVVHSLIFFSIYYFAIIMIWRVSKEVFYPYLSILLTLLTVAFLMVVFSLYYLLFYSGKITTGFTSCEVKNIFTGAQQRFRFEGPLPWYKEVVDKVNCPYYKTKN